MAISCQKVGGGIDRLDRPPRLAGSTLKCEVCFGDALQKATSDGGGWLGLEDGWGVFGFQFGPSPQDTPGPGWLFKYRWGSKKSLEIWRAGHPWPETRMFDDSFCSSMYTVYTIYIYIFIFTFTSTYIFKKEIKGGVSSLLGKCIVLRSKMIPMTLSMSSRMFFFLHRP